VVQNNLLYHVSIDRELDQSHPIAGLSQPKQKANGKPSASINLPKEKGMHQFFYYVLLLGYISLYAFPFLDLYYKDMRLLFSRK